MIHQTEVSELRAVTRASERREDDRKKYSPSDNYRDMPPFQVRSVPTAEQDCFDADKKHTDAREKKNQV